MREALKSRGWVEKFENTQTLPALKKKKRDERRKNAINESGENGDENKDDVDDGDGDGDVTDNEPDEYEIKTKPWDENNGYYGILSRCVRNYPSYLIFSVRNVDSSVMHKDTYLNHFNKNGAFTTKVVSFLFYFWVLLKAEEFL